MRWISSFLREWTSRKTPNGAVVGALLNLEALEDRLLPAISGLVFQAFNGDGVYETNTTAANQGSGSVGLAVDQGIAGVTVTCYNSTNVAVSSTTTAANGTYALATSGPGQYRIEFSNIPAGFFDSARGSSGTFSGTTVQFVDNGGTANLGLIDPTQYAPNNPELFGVEEIHGDPTGPDSSLFEVLDFQYSSGAQHPGSTLAQYSNPTTHTTEIPYGEVGTVDAITYDSANNMLYVAAFTKKYTGYGPGSVGYGTGPNAVQGSNGAIYAINPVSGAVNLLTDFNDANMFPGSTGTNFRTRDASGNPYDYTTDSLNTGWDAVGKSAFGGLDVSSDGKTLYVMNLGDRMLYSIPLTGAINNTTVKGYSLLPALPADVTGVGSAEGGALGDLRPFAVRVHQERNSSGVLQDYVYIGAVNSAQFTQNASDLHAYVFRFDPVTGTFTVNPHTGTRTWFEITNMTYNRGDADLFHDGGVTANDANWHPWTTSFVQQSPFGAGSMVEAQPMLTDLAFDAQGNLTLGFRDRLGDQSTNDALTGNPYSDQDATNSGDRYEGYPDGEVLRAFGTPTSGWVLENDGKGPGGVPAGSGVGNGFGPGGGQFYGQDDFPGDHEHVPTGELLQLPGYPDIIASVIDPTEISTDFRTGGFRWFGNGNTGAGNGTWDKSYQLYSTDQAGTFQKENGIGGIAAIVPPPAIEIGDRVWLDTNGDGIQDPGEPGIAGVTVQLYNAEGTLLATAVTDANGDYLFSNGTGSDTASAVYGITGLTADTDGFTVRVDDPANFAVGGPLHGLVAAQPFAGTDPGIDSNGQAFSANDIRAAVDTGIAGDNNHTFDFGFTTQPDLALSKTHNSTFYQGDAADTYTITVSNTGTGPTTGAVTVTDVLPTGLSPTAADRGVINGWTLSYAGQTVTAVRSDPLAAGAAYPPLIITVSVADNAPPTLLNVASVTSPGVPTTPAETGSDLTPIGTGIVTLGSYVWLDVNGNGLQNAGEAGIGGVTVDLYNSSGKLLARAVTDASGHYLFSDGPGQSSASQIFGIPGLMPNAAYVIAIDNTANFVGSGPLAGLSLTQAFVGSNPTLNSKAILVNGMPTIYASTGDPGTSDLLFDFGFTNALTKRRFIH